MVVRPPVFISEWGLGGAFRRFPRTRLNSRSSVGSRFAMVDSAITKVERAAYHLTALSELFGKKAPFEFVVQTNIITGDRTAKAKANVAVIQQAAAIIGDIIHNLRTALDHVYWDIISQFVPDEEDRRRVQFPFARKRGGFNGALKTRFAGRAGTGFVSALFGLQPYAEGARNDLFYLIHDLDLIDKHKLLIPTSNIADIGPADSLYDKFPDLPRKFTGPGRIAFRGPNASLAWKTSGVSREEAGAIIPPTMHMYERKADVPIDVIFDIGSGKENRQVLPTLEEMINLTRNAIPLLRSASKLC